MDCVTKDPEDVLDYGFDWSTWLDDGDTIATSSWAVDGSGLVIDDESETTTVTTVWLSAGDLEKVYQVTNHVISAEGREKDWSFVVKMQSQ